MKLRSATWLLLAVGAAGILTFADRAPAVAKAVLGVARHANQALERRAGIDWISRGDLPFAGDTIGHFVLWATLTVVAAGALRAWPIPLLLGMMITAALGSELLQGVITSSREVSTSDFAANILGVALAGALLMIRDVTRPEHSP